jgi:hypothetical protein
MRRFVVYACMAFITVFVGISWAARGFPMRFSGPAPIQQLRPTLDVKFGDHSGELKREHLGQQQSQDPDNYKRDPLRLEALQAANAYALSPCDQTMKANLVAAVRAYAAADVEIRKCSVVFGGCDAAWDKALATYSTPLDLRAQAAMHEAFGKGGVSKADFPPEMAMSVMHLASSQGSPVSACARSAGVARR